MIFKSEKRNFIKLLFVALTLVCFSINVFAAKKEIVVAQDGTGTFKTIAEAISAIPENNTTHTIIRVKNGVYKEKLTFPKTKNNITLLGEDVSKTIITFDDYASKQDSSGKNIGTFGSSTVFINGADFTAENITFENSSGPVGQAVAISVGGDRTFFKNCRFLGFQDTIFTSGDSNHQYFYKCYIEGAVDFIFGGATVLFDECELYCKRGGYITAASTKEGQKFGYVFLNCNIGGDAKVNSMFLGRPWRANANVAFIKCEMSNVIKREGWNNWGKESNEKTALYSEYNNTGEGAESEKRVSWSKQLTKSEAKRFTKKNILENWKPKK